jgi:mono/diheme cytochrome c family protein
MRKIILLLIVLVALSACGSLSDDITPPPGSQLPAQPQASPTEELPIFPMVAPNPARGEPIYTEKCAPCHGDTGLGDGPDAAELPNPVAPLGSQAVARQAAPADWYLMVSNGNLERYMPPFKSLSGPERWDVIAYAFSLSTSADEIAGGQELYAQNCSDCHGETGQGDGIKTGELSASPVDFTDQSFMGMISAADLFATISAGQGEMHAFGDLAEADRWALTAYLRSLTFAAPEAQANLEDGSSDATPAGAESPESTPQPAETPVEAGPETDATETLGSIFIEVANGSGGDLPLDSDVILHGYDGMEEIYTQTISLPENGLAVFEEVPMPPGRVYLATAEFDGLAYGSNLIQVDESTTEGLLGITVFDATTDTSVLSIERLHIFFEFLGPDTIQVIELVLLANNSATTVTSGDDGPVVVFELPEGASNLEVQESMQLRLLPAENLLGIGDVRPAAEAYDITFAYLMPYDKKKLDLALPLPLDTSAVIIIAPEDGVKLKGAQLQDGGSRDFQGVPYRTYNSASLEAGDALEFSLSGTPKLPAGMDTSASSNSTTNLIIGIGAFGLVLIAAGVYLLGRNRQDDELMDEESAIESPGEESSEELMDTILALDDLYKSGDLPEAAYLKRRAELKARLQELVGE